MKSTSQRVLLACSPCFSSKVKCDSGRPCQRCIRRGTESKCVDRKVLRATPLPRNRIGGGRQACMRCSNMKLACDGERRPCPRCKRNGDMCVDYCTVLSASLVLPMSTAGLYYTPPVITKTRNIYRPMHRAVYQSWKSAWRQFTPLQILEFMAHPIRVKSLLAFASTALSLEALKDLEKALISFASKANTDEKKKKPFLNVEKSITCPYSSSTSVYEKLHYINTTMSHNNGSKPVSKEAIKFKLPEVSKMVRAQSVMKIGFKYDARSRSSILCALMNEEAETVFGIKCEHFEPLLHEEFHSKQHFGSEEPCDVELKEAPYFWRLFHPLNWPTLVQLTLEMWINMPKEPISATMDLVRNDGQVVRSFTKWETIFDSEHGGFVAIVVRFNLK